MTYPSVRMRRLRENSVLRDMVRETNVTLNDLIMPLFIVENIDQKEEIPSMPGQWRYPLDALVIECKRLHKLGVKAIILFGIPNAKDAQASSAYATDGIVQRAVAEIKQALPNMLVITDVCLCEYTSHGHCGLVDGNRILNDSTIDLLSKTAVSHAQAGADIIAPSDMMDGRIVVIRKSLDEFGFEHIPIMSYAAKYASAYYGPFRDAADSTPQFGDRRSYQMEPGNSREAIREVELDIEEGADIVMIKPALAYLDIIHRVREMSDLPIAAYNVSGEYSMVKAASRLGWLDEKRVILENLLAIKRAGADLILTYHAAEVAGWL